jgi:hypothetical protein
MGAPNGRLEEAFWVAVRVNMISILLFAFSMAAGCCVFVVMKIQRITLRGFP